MSAPREYRVRVERRCGCGRTAGMTSLSVLRAGGWRLYDGPSLTGKELHYTVCPWCAGTTDRPDPETAWTVGCSSCDWVYEPEDEDEEPLTEARAREMERDHWCSPRVWTERPKRSYYELRPNNLDLLDLVAS
jgi:hypothetical protein